MTTKETLKQEIENAISQLLDMVENSCWNKISKDCLFIISEIKKQEEKNFFQQRVERKRINSRKSPISLEQAIDKLLSLYENLYDINLYVYHAKKGITIIEIQYFPKSSLEEQYLKTIKNNPPMIHCKIGIPPYRKKDSDTYDVNWKLGGLRHEWNMFWWKRNHKPLKR